MAQRAGILNGSNLDQDKDFAAMVDAIYGSTTGISLGNGLLVTTNSVAAGRCLIKCTRTSTTPNETLWVVFENTAAVVINTTGTTKVWVAIDQTRINDASLNTNPAGTGIGAIATGANYPASNYIPLASVTGGVITDARPGVIFGSHVVTGILKFTEGASIVAAATTDLSTATGNTFHITGNTGITSFGILPAGTIMYATFDGTPLITHNGTSLIIPGAANYTAAAGDQFTLKSEGSGNWRVQGITKANGTAIVPTADINGLASATTLGEADQFIEYNASASGNRKETRAALRQYVQMFGGNGADGAVDGTADITITGSNNTIIEKNYSSFAAGNAPTQAYTNDPAAGSNIVLNMASTALFAVNDYVRVSSSAGSETAKVTVVSAGVSITVNTLALNHTTTTPVVTRLRKLTITPTGCIFYFRVKGNCDLTNWYFDFEGKGMIGGTGSANASGTNGTASTFFINGAGVGGVAATGNGGANLTESGTGGGGGSSSTTSGTAGTAGSGASANPAGGVAGTTSASFASNVWALLKQYKIDVGSGGGAGGAVTLFGESGGNGGAGGGAFVGEVGGNLNLGSAFINCNGLAGSNGTAVANGSGTVTGGGGGGGGSGSSIFGYAGTLTGTATSTVAGGVGGTGGGATGGTGGVGVALSYKNTYIT